ncbi:adenylyltransferase/cytidyltransferase family protein [Ilumatobacter sp.]|uniref:adenylyltransferase/cytidyltransferase family protein n=1 Tax=Ilumatobacter sp. TaxID=1967498 RepID=UPI003B5278E4
MGRFDPPHLGHSHMIDAALERCERLVVFVNSSFAHDSVPGELRGMWLSQLHPTATVRVVRHHLDTDFDDEELWARWMALFREHWPYVDGPHAVFSSDTYVSGIAQRFDAEAVRVDPEREAVPISATQIRDRPADHLHMVAPPVRSWIESNWLV